MLTRLIKCEIMAVMALKHKNKAAFRIKKNIFTFQNSRTLMKNILEHQQTQTNKKLTQTNPSPWPQGMLEIFSGWSFLLLYKETQRTLTTIYS